MPIAETSLQRPGASVPIVESPLHPGAPEGQWDPDVSAWQATRRRAHAPRQLPRRSVGGMPRPTRHRQVRAPTPEGTGILAGIVRGAVIGMGVSVIIELLRVATLASGATGGYDGSQARERIFGITHSFALFEAARAASQGGTPGARRQTLALLAGAWGATIGYAVGLTAQAALPASDGTADGDVAIAAALSCSALAAGLAWWAGGQDPAAARRQRLARRMRQYAIA